MLLKGPGMFFERLLTAWINFHLTCRDFFFKVFSSCGTVIVTDAFQPEIEFVLWHTLMASVTSELLWLNSLPLHRRYRVVWAHLILFYLVYVISFIDFLINVWKILWIKKFLEEIMKDKIMQVYSHKLVSKHMSGMKTNDGRCNCQWYNPHCLCELRVCHASDLQQECHHSLLWLCVRSKPCAQRIHVEGCRLANTLWIAESCESCLSVVSSWSTHTHASERQVTVQNLDHWIVYNKGSWACSFLHLFDVLFVLTEQINCQRFWSFFDLINHVVNVMVRNDG